MRRKLIKQGVNALTLTIPSEWTSRFGLKAGDELDIEPEGSMLVIRSPGYIKSEKANVHLKESSIHVYRQLLSNAYRKGFDEIKVTFECARQLPVIQQAVDELMGFEITSMQKDLLTLKSVAVPDIREFDVLYKRTFFTIKTAFDFLIDDLESGNFDTEKIVALQRNLLKLCSFCRRILHKMGFPDITNAYAKYILLVLNDDVMSQLKYCYLDALKLKKPSKKSVEYAKAIKEYFESVINAIFHEDKSKIHSLTDKKYTLYGQKKDIQKNVPRDDSCFVQELSILVRLMGDYLSPLCLLSLKEEKQRNN